MNMPRSGSGQGVPVQSGFGRSAVLETAYWIGLFVVLPLLLPPALLWTSSSTGLRWVPYFRAGATWVLLIYGTIVVLVRRSDASLLGVMKSVPRIAVPFKFLWATIILVLISTFFSNVGTGVAALGSAERADGTLMLASWFALAMTSAELARSPAFRPRVFLLVIGAGSLVTAAWILLQASDADPLTFISRRHYHLYLPSGAFGHSGVAMAYLGICAIVLIAYWLREGGATWWRLMGIGLIGAGMGAAGGRAGALGLVAASMLIAASTIRRRRGLSALTYFVILLLAGAACGYGLSPHGQAKARESIAALSGGDMSLSDRIVAWKVATRVIGAHPVFGVGPDNFNNVLWAHATQSEQRALLRETLGFEPAVGSYKIAGNVIAYANSANGTVNSKRLNWDKAHDYFLDLAIATGLPALIAFVGFLVSALWGLLRSTETLEWAIGLALVAFLVWALAWFPNVALDPIVWGLVGVGIGLHWKDGATSAGTSVA